MTSLNSSGTILKLQGSLNEQICSVVPDLQPSETTYMGEEVGEDATTNSNITNSTNDTTQSSPWSQATTFWFDKGFLIIEHIRTTFKMLLLRPGFIVSIDEMMVRLRKSSAEKNRLKNKAIAEGYKLFALCDSKTG